MVSKSIKYLPEVALAEGTIRNSTLPYETHLHQDPRWALKEGSRHFDEKSAVHQTLQTECFSIQRQGRESGVLVTTDSEIAKKYGMHDESEFLG